MRNRTNDSDRPHILVAGGDCDPNIAAILRCLKERNLEHQALLVGANSHPRVTWDLDKDVLLLDGKESRPTAVFIRYDVFTGLASRRAQDSYRALAWFTTIHGWAVSHRNVRLLNRANAFNVTNKPYVLQVAKEAGFETPPTLVSNDRDLLTSESDRRELIVKPVNGGDFTRELNQIIAEAPSMNGSLAAPAIVQDRLVPPEIRVYRIGGRCFPYQLVADALDYRSIADCKVVPLELPDLPDGLTNGLARLMDRLEMNFAAADFKACPRTGRLFFLEINNSPMFAAFDGVSAGRLTAAMADFLSS